MHCRRDNVHTDLARKASELRDIAKPLLRRRGGGISFHSPNLVKRVKATTLKIERCDGRRMGCSVAEFFRFPVTANRMFGDFTPASES